MRLKPAPKLIHKIFCNPYCDRNKTQRKYDVPIKSNKILINQLFLVVHTFFEITTLIPFRKKHNKNIFANTIYDWLAGAMFNFRMHETITTTATAAAANTVDKGIYRRNTQIERTFNTRHCFCTEINSIYPLLPIITNFAIFN